MRRSHLIALTAGLGSLVVFAAITDSCEPTTAASHVPRRSHARRSRSHRAWSTTAWVAPAALTIDAEVLAPIDASVPTELDAGFEEPVHPELVERLCRPLVASICAARSTCGCSDDGCFERELESCELWLGCAYPSTAPELVVDDRSLASCLASLRTTHAQCLAPPLPEECYGVLVDPARPGQRCAEWTTSCVDGSCVDGVCRRTPRLGERCDFDCAAGAFCEDGRCRAIQALECGSRDECSAGLACVGGRCAIGRGEGERCEAEGECQARFACIDERCTQRDRCRRHGDCAEGGFCVGASTLLCQPTAAWPLAREGETCSTERGCERGLVCRGGACTRAPSLGEPCVEGECELGLSCEWNGAYPECVRLALKEGEPCPRYDAICGPGLVCRFAADGPRCMRSLGAGQPCASGACARGLTCEDVFDDGRCVPEICDDDAAARWTCDVD